VSGGGSKARYFVSGTFNQDLGLLQQNGQNNFNTNIKLNSYSLRSNVHINLSKSTELVVRLNGSFDDYTGPIPGEGGATGGATAYQMAIRANPVLFPAFYEDVPGYAHIKHIMFGNFESQGEYLNPYAEIARGYRESARSAMYAQAELNQDLGRITEGLKFRLLSNTTRNAYFDMARSYSPYYYHTESIDLATGRVQLEMMNEATGTQFITFNPGNQLLSAVLYAEAGLNYNRLFNEKHQISALLVHIMRNYLDANATSLQASLPARNIGLSGKMTYAFANRYYTEFNFGYNGSEKFAKKNKFGFFPSAGLAWSISNEKFFEPLKSIINNLRIRSTYGLVGNDQIGRLDERFFYLADVDLNNNNLTYFGQDFNFSRRGISINSYSNTNVTWEKAYKLNLALELGLFNTIEIIAEYFTDRRSNILQERADIPSTMGLASSISANIGEAYSNGVDLSASINQRLGPNWTAQMQGNFTYSTGKYTHFEELAYGVDYRQRNGKPINQQFGYIAERLFISDEEVAHSAVQNFGELRGGDIKYMDINGDGVIDLYDQVPIGYPTVPEIIYGFGFSTRFKSLDISAFFQGSARSSFFIDYSATSPFTESAQNYSGETRKGNNQLLLEYAQNYWSEENQDIYALYPRLSTSSTLNNAQQSTWWLRNGDFLRVKQIELGYSLRPAIRSNFKFDRIRFYGTVTNPFILSGFKSWDIEQGASAFNYPIQRVLNFGMQLTF